MTSSRPAALLLSPVLPRPGGSGRALRAWDWLVELARDHRVLVVVCANDDRDLSLPDDYPAAAVHFIGDALRPTRGLWRLCGLMVPALAGITRRTVIDWLHPVTTERVPSIATSIAAEGSVRRIVVFRAYLDEVAAVLARRFPDAGLELDMDDLESDSRMSIAAALFRMKRFAEALYYWSAALQYRLIERRLGRRYPTIWLAAGEDARIASERLGRQVGCRPNRLGMPGAVEALPRSSSSVSLRLLFVGTLNYPPNEEAVHSLLRHVLPALRRRLACSWQLTVVGRHAQPTLKAAMSRVGEVEYVEDAEDVTAWYAASDIALVPIRAGGGTKFKTLEAFGYGVPVVSTRHGVRGLAARSGVHYWQADDPDAFVEGVLALNADRALATRIAEAGRSLHHRHYRIPD